MNKSYYELKKSKFYGYLYNVKTIDEVNNIIEEIKKDNKKAKHVVYAYKINDKEKVFNDKEPTGTVYPLLDIINKQNKDNVLVIVVRYFGGTLLGTGPLTRSYSKVVSYLFK